jgi:hypothetical protein
MGDEWMDHGKNLETQQIAAGFFTVLVLLI